MGLEEANKKRLSEQQQQMENMRKMQEEQKCSITIRRMIQKVQAQANPENIETLKKELDECLATDLEKCGSQKDKVMEEVTAGLAKAQERIDQVREQHRKLEEQKKEMEKKKQEALDKVQALLKE